MNDQTENVAAELARTRRELADARQQLGRWQASGVPSVPTRIHPKMIEQQRQAEQERIRGAIRERQERDTQREQEREQARRQRAEDELTAHLDDQLTRFIAAGGKSSDWPAMRKRVEADYLAEKMKEDKVEAAAARLRASGRYVL